MLILTIMPCSLMKCILREERHQLGAPAGWRRDSSTYGFASGCKKENPGLAGSQSGAARSIPGLVQLALAHRLTSPPGAAASSGAAMSLLRQAASQLRGRTAAAAQHQQQRLAGEPKQGLRACCVNVIRVLYAPQRCRSSGIVGRRHPAGTRPCAAAPAPPLGHPTSPLGSFTALARAMPVRFHGDLIACSCHSSAHSL